MSGGSFNYLCFAEDYELFERVASLQDMAEALRTAGANDAAEETARVIAYMEHARRQVRVRAERLQPVWKAMEWWRSSDWGEDQFRETLAKYRDE